MTESGKIALWIAGGLAGVILLGKKAQEGIGAVNKRRIYREISLAQQAGVDFTKPYEDLTASEIKILERVSRDTGYTETYYKSLKKAYDAISGIGEAYDVVDENGNTILTWTDDPQASSLTADNTDYDYLHYAHDIDEERQYALDNAARMLEDREARLAEQRKRLKKSGRSAQMALFGCGTGVLNTRNLLEPSLIIWLNRNLDQREIRDTTDEMMENRTSLQRANGYLYDRIYDLVNDWCEDTATDPDTIWSVVDPEDIFWAM